MTESWQSREVSRTTYWELGLAVIIFAVILGALFFLDVPADWRTPIVVAVGAIYIVVSVATGSQAICAQVNVSVDHALHTMLASLSGSTRDVEGDDC